MIVSRKKIIDEAHEYLLKNDEQIIVGLLDRLSPADQYLIIKLAAGFALRKLDEFRKELV